MGIRSVASPKSKISFLIAFLFTLIIMISLSSCDNSPSGPNDDSYGLTGRVVDTAGHPIAGAEIYCLYYYSYIPTSQLDKSSLKKVTVDSVFQLYQNIPNPFSESTFIRFYLPAPASIKLTVTEKSSGAIKYTLQNNLKDGLFQIYLNHLVMNNQLKNGVYKYSLTAKDLSGNTYSAEKELLVINDSSAANVITDNNGNYFFNYENIFEGDTIVTTSDGGFYYSTVLTSDVNLMIVKDGYIPKLIHVTLYPDILLRQDIVMVAEAKK